MAKLSWIFTYTEYRFVLYCYKKGALAVMKKLSLKDVKAANKKLILGEIAKAGTLSRTELTAKTSLSGSTVSMLVGELLEDRILAEEGTAASGGGRPRVALRLNAGFGNLAVLEIRQQQTLLRLFSVEMEERSSHLLPYGYNHGNELLLALTDTLREYFGDPLPKTDGLAGIGLLFENTMVASQCSVMVSTSLSSATISLQDALSSQFRVPVMEETMESNTIADALLGRQWLEEFESSVVVSLERRVLASVVLNGKPVCLREGSEVLDLTPRLLPGTDDAKGAMPVPVFGGQAQCQAAIYRLASLLSPLCVWFCITDIVLTGNGAGAKNLVPAMQEELRRQLPGQQPPAVTLLQNAGRDISWQLAGRLRNQLFGLA